MDGSVQVQTGVVRVRTDSVQVLLGKCPASNRGNFFMAEAGHVIEFFVSCPVDKYRTGKEERSVQLQTGSERVP